MKTKSNFKHNSKFSKKQKTFNYNPPLFSTKKSSISLFRLKKKLFLKYKNPLNKFLFSLNISQLNCLLKGCKYLYSIIMVKAFLKNNLFFGNLLLNNILNIKYLHMYINTFYYLKHFKNFFTSFKSYSCFILKNYKKKTKVNLVLKLTKLKLEKIVFNSLNIKAIINLKSVLKIVDPEALKKIIPTNIRF